MNTINKTHNVIFITGTDTDVGKTFVCALLLRFFREKGIDACYQKWVSTGSAEISGDLFRCLDFAGINKESINLDELSPYRFSLPASPHLAAETDKRAIDSAVLIDCTRSLALKYEIVLLEGVGGVLVPLRRDLLLADLISGCKFRTLVVARSGLGTLNHTLLTLEALRNRDIPITGVILSDSSPDENEHLVEDNMRSIVEIGDVKVFGRIPWCENLDDAYGFFRPIGERIVKELKAQG
ncbi:MAG: dethiobiotin synthase [Proteobacteria bacterium]|nr:dethiobiotin synthase [Pseudomonadota bacterium]MBU1709152.1 dethiobiotin synthase [Pseudomonadota bacterium]